MKKLALVAALAVVAASADAAVVSAAFTGTFESGSLTGQSFSGSLVYDTSQPVVLTFNNFNSKSYFFAPLAEFKVSVMGEDKPMGSTEAQVLLANNGNNSAVGFAARDPGAFGYNLNFYYNSGLAPMLPAAALLESAVSREFAVSAPGTNTSRGNFIFTSLIESDVPEPATWGMMLLGFGLVGTAARRRSMAATVAA